MNDNEKVKPPLWFWIISVTALIWNLMGVMAYLGTVYVTEGMKADMAPAQLSLLEETPSWVTAAFAIAVFGGSLGCVGLLLKKEWSKSLFGISLMGIVSQMAYSIFISNAMQVYGHLQALLMPFLVFTVGIALLFFARHANYRRWLT